ncbi:hypothetical protein HYX00_04600 [Candidatus Woesearchaeota archaeon]|nr:hypothetical protein [Candidatus Woesearchaeota archaeon]
MFWKKENNTEKKLNQINELLKRSFANVKRDTTNIFQWLNYFYKKNMEQEQLIRQLQLELSYIPKTREEIKHIIDDYYSFGSIMTKIRELNDKVDELARKQIRREEPYPMLRETPKELQTISDIEIRLGRLEQKKMSIKEKIIKRLTRNSKEYIKSVILSYIGKYEKISALQLKEMIVDEQNFCSKSSFYRLLEEIEQLDNIGVIKQGKEKHYMSKTTSHRLV